MNNKDINFPKVRCAIENLIEDEDGNITRKRLVSIGTMVVIMSLMSGINVFARHGSLSCYTEVVTPPSNWYNVN